MKTWGKNKTILIIAAVVVLTAGIYTSAVNGVFSGRHSASRDVYYCPMHPTYTSDRPGSCPICNMSLVKREPEKSAGSSGPQGAFNGPGLSAGQEDHTGHGVSGDNPGRDPGASSPSEPMKTFTVEELTRMSPAEICLLHKCSHGTCLISMSGEFARLGKCPHCGEDLGVVVRDALPTGLAAVQLSSESARAIGVETDVVRKMRVTKTLRAAGRIAYDPELFQTQQEYLQGIAALGKAENAEPESKVQAARFVESAKIKLRLMGFGEELVRDLEKSGNPDRSLLYSDAGGRVWLYASIYEPEIPLVRIGDVLTAEVPSLPGKKYEGVVRSMDSVVDPVTRTVRIRAVLDNPDGFLKPDMYVNAALQSDLGEQLVVPKEAVFRTGLHNLVFVADGRGSYLPREADLGVEADSFYQVRGGLREGERVVTSGNFLIDSESRLKAALLGMEDGGGGHSHGA